MKGPSNRQNTGVSATASDYLQSTNVSSPVQAVTRRRLQKAQRSDESHVHRNAYSKDGFIVSDGDDESDEDAFEPVRVKGKSSAKPKKELGPPITIDEEIARLNQTHKMVLEDFVIHAKRECSSVRL